METTTIIAIRDLLSQEQENIDVYQQYNKDMDASHMGQRTSIASKVL